MSLAIQVSGLAKRYRLGGIDAVSYRTLRDTLMEIVKPARPHAHEKKEIWALRDVCFEVEEGEAIGIIGANGAGKSTLLKILSKITEPSAGVARLRGRVASLLEVGTGFHPELTGRENIFLNGAILGMKRKEIRAVFDRIVAFAEIEEFLDMPVKRYSSGMYVRLAFAVAAHLTPEILIVDEVLAVGDIKFQRRCLGRMSEVAHSGRTVLFVSHNLAAIEDLCGRTILLRRGRIEAIGPTADVISRYVSSVSGSSSWDFTSTNDREGTGSARITSIELLSADGSHPLEELPFLSSCRFRIHYRVEEKILGPHFGIAILSDRNERLFLTDTPEVNFEIDAIEGEGIIDCVVQHPNILPGSYRLEAWITDAPHSYADHLRMVGDLEVVVGSWSEGSAARLLTHDRGRVFVRSEWLHSPNRSGGES